MSTEEERLLAIEQRLTRLEARLSEPTTSTTQPRPADKPPHLSAEPAAPVSLEASDISWPPPQIESASWSATKILGWSGASALVLAAAYLIKLAVTGGWLTPSRQITFAILAGLVLIAAGLKFRKSDREYASLLPAGGIVILFLSIYGAHLYYGLIGIKLAALSVVLVCLFSLTLCRLFSSQIYALFAVVGSYSAPFILAANTNNITDLVIYYSCWSVVFCVYAIWVRDRRVYLLALYLAMVGFDLLWRWNGAAEWSTEVIFQLTQFLIFTSCAVLYAIRHQDPMNFETAIIHAPALLIFYVLEYAVLDQHIPELAPWIAVGSAALLLVAYQIARRYLDTSLQGSKWLLAAYCALVLLHAGYLESVPDAWTPWLAAALLVIAALMLFLRQGAELLSGPIGWVIGLIFIVNYLRILSDYRLGDVAAHDYLLIVYAVELYSAYYFIRNEVTLSAMTRPLIYAAHIAALAAPAHLFENQFAISLSWGILALTCLVISLQIKDRTLGQSSLLIFALSAAKVMLFDLSDTTPLIRIACLVVLGVTFYLGGWLYRKVDALEPG